MEVNSWIEANQRYVMAALTVVRVALERHAARAKEPADSNGAPLPQSDVVQQTVQEAVDAMSAPPALETLCKIFGLSPFERDIVLLCAGMELDSGFSPLCASVQGDPKQNYPTFSLALGAFPNAHWSALLPTASLRYWRLIEVGTANSLTQSPLRINERILHYLIGLSVFDEQLLGFVTPVPVQTEGVSSQRCIADQIVALWSRTASTSNLPTVELVGHERLAKPVLASWVCTDLSRGLYQMSARALPTAPGELDILLRLLEREALLSGFVLLLDCEMAQSADPALQTLVAYFIDHLHSPLIVATRESMQNLIRPLCTFEVCKPTTREQYMLWEKNLGLAATSLNGDLDRLTAQFHLNAQTIRAISLQAMGEPAVQPAEFPRRLWQACRRQARPRLEDLARRIEPMATWDDLVLPALQIQTLRQITVHARQRTKVYETWGFAEKSGRGLGINALFYGVSGTGKTMAAEVLAHDLQLDLYHIDLSQVVSKYIGETEKNLFRIFDAAEEGGAILLFDEADALFGKRSDVKDSHDRYANIEVSYLLQRMEAYRGIAILTTNMKNALDSAFLRRIRFIVPFPFPDAVQRAEIWRRIFPARTPTEGLDADKLARLNVVGGNIRNIALNAAFLAADADEPVRMEHLAAVARVEYAKMEKPLTDAEIRGWT